MTLNRNRHREVLFFFGLFLLFFIPLYPKIPLFSPIEQYIVRIRLEDILISTAVLYWIYLAVTKKIKVAKYMFGLMSLYILVGTVSLFSAIFVLGTIPQQQLHILKSLLHLFRYVEYFSLFFIINSAIKTKKQVYLLLLSLLLIVSCLSLYGIGQRYARFPVYSTMNREYSKGIQLVLDSPYARVQSTFAGHYDFGAYLVIVLPFILGLAWLSTNKRIRYIAWISFILGLWGLLASASRSSFIGFVVAMAIGIGGISLVETNMRSRIIGMIKRGSVTFGLCGIMLLFFGGNLSQLFITAIQGVPALGSIYQKIVQIIPQAEKIDNAVIPQYTNPVPMKPTQTPSPQSTTPPDVYVDVPEKIEIITIDESGQQVISYEERPRTFSQCAQEKGLSLCIRLEALWPQALKGFEKNRLLGSGYATLNKVSLFHFPEADGTDNNYLRVLGETGLLGLITFFSVIGFALMQTFQQLVQVAKSHKKRNFDQRLKLVLLSGYVAGTVGLLVNALYIDVFVASKVALTYWALTGLVLASMKIKTPQKLTKSISINH